MLVGSRTTRPLQYRYLWFRSRTFRRGRVKHVKHFPPPLRQFRESVSSNRSFRREIRTSYRISSVCGVFRACISTHTHTHRYYGDIITRKKERNVSVDDIEVTCTSLQKGDRVRALWKLSDRKDYPGTVTKIVDKKHVSIHYDDDSNKKKCPLNWTMPLKRKSFDPAAVTFGQTVRWCSILLTRSRNTHFKH